MKNGQAHIKIVNPEKEGNKYIGTVNRQYYKDSYFRFDDILTKEEIESEDAHFFIIMTNTSRFVTNIIHGVGL